MTNPENLMALYSEILLAAPNEINDHNLLQSTAETLKGLLDKSQRELTTNESATVFWLEAIRDLTQSRLNG